eukprot:TRINITY_DN46474_c0_g1_i1.p1 TRINITY_DN46474_c0_g1~~TRINITY_DN46474_c0_g1_i1.p1  ORF type:complete len:191 (-),score=35.69 TRINITY_DN46474_c0_g1_i1:72-644(-)
MLTGEHRAFRALQLRCSHHIRHPLHLLVGHALTRGFGVIPAVSSAPDDDTRLAWDELREFWTEFVGEFIQRMGAVHRVAHEHQIRVRVVEDALLSVLGAGVMDANPHLLPVDGQAEVRDVGLRRSKFGAGGIGAIPAQSEPGLPDLAPDQPTPDFCCLLYTSDAADEEDSVDLGGRRIIKKKNSNCITHK